MSPLICAVCGEEITPAETAIGGYVHLLTDSRWCKDLNGRWVLGHPA